jgi:FixJ family two-component response regulator
MNLCEADRRAALRQESGENPMIYIVDNDDSDRASLEWLIGRAGWQPTSFATAGEFLAYARCPMPSCLLLNVTLPDLSGLDVQELLVDQREVPIIFIAGKGDVPTTVRAMKAGAVEFLVKPYRVDELLRAIPRALEISVSALRDQARLKVLHSRYSYLSPREREVMERVVSGRLNKQVALDLGIAENTVKVHRFNVMRKMQADSLADLVRLAGCLEIPSQLGVPIQVTPAFNVTFGGHPRDNPYGAWVPTNV